MLSWKNPKQLINGFDQYLQGLCTFQFRCKEILSSHDFFLKLFPNHSYAIKNEENVTTVLSYYWDRMSDFIWIKPTINFSRKSRGSYLGKPLEDMSITEIHNQNITKRIASR